MELLSILEALSVAIHPSLNSSHLKVWFGVFEIIEGEGTGNYILNIRYASIFKQPSKRKRENL